MQHFQFSLFSSIHCDLTSLTENYLQNTPGGEVPGALGLGQAAATNIVNAVFIASYITPVLAAVVADSWLGRHQTMICAAMYQSLFILQIYSLTVSLLTSSQIRSRRSHYSLRNVPACRYSRRGCFRWGYRGLCSYVVWIRRLQCHCGTFHW